MRLFNASRGSRTAVPFEPADEMIDWSRLAEPQADQYDTEAILRLASTTASADRPRPYRRTPVGDSPTAFDGQVAIRHVYRSLPEFEGLSESHPDAPLDHPNIAAAAEYVRAWPIAFAQCQCLLEAIHPALDPRMPMDMAESHRGSSSHSFESLFGTLWATIYCPSGMAEAIVHEMAHQKLRALGVSFESATTIVGNDPSELYVSPVIKDRLRPMSAVLHAQYSFVHVTTLDMHILENERSPRRREVLGRVLARNLARIEEGYETICRHFNPGEHGREFMEGFSGWTERTIASARSALGRGAGSFARFVPAAAVEPPAASAAALPHIDTSVNMIRTEDRDVEVLLTFNSPRIVLLANVLSHEECDALIEYCEPRLTRSTVVADADGNVRAQGSRTSHGVSLRRGETANVARIEARLASLAQWPAERGEGLQVLRYRVGEQYRPHVDWMNPDMAGVRRHMEVGGQRLATIVLYLSDVESGGATFFPAVGLEIRPRKGGALFFLNTDTRHVADPLTRHAGMPVVNGVKFAANKWLRQHEF